MTDRVIALIDMDCFYCQVETRLNPDLKGLPVAVVQYNEWQGGGIIAVNYEARDRGVTRHMRGQDAKMQCPEIVLVSVPTLRGKADLSRYREAGREVVAVLCTFTECVERASVDEAYVDLTEAVNKRILENALRVSANELANTFIVGYTTEGSNNEEERVPGLNSWLSDIHDTSFQDVAAQKLAIGAVIVEDIRKAIFETTGFRCSAGIAHNKILAKLACGLHKPNCQTVVPQSSVPDLYKHLPAKKVRSLGGKLGDDLRDRLGIKVMADLLKFTERELQKSYDTKTGTWLYNIARGYDFDAVTPRLLSKSIGCCKKFPGKTALATAADVQHWVTKLAEELLERLNEDHSINKRRAQLLTVSMGLEINRKDVASSKSLSLTNYNLERIVAAAYGVLKKTCTEDPSTKVWSPPIKSLGISAGKFINETSNKIINFFKTEEVCEESSKKCQIEENLSPVERTALQDVSNNTGVSGKINIGPTDDKKQPSFFEKMLLNGSSNKEGKLNILPDLNKADLLSESENSRDSCIFDKMSVIATSSTDSPQKDKNSYVKMDNNSEKHCFFKSSLPSRKKEDAEKVNVLKTNKSISSFFASAAVKEKWINPEEIFPDLSAIDDSVVELLPPSFKKKVLELRKVTESSEVVETCNIDKVSILNLPCHAQVENIKHDEGKTEVKEENCQKMSNNKEIFGDIFESSSHEKCNPLSESIKCNECGENVPLTEKELHLDRHLAIKLDNELNYKNRLPSVNNQSKKLFNVQPKNKRKAKNVNSSDKVIKKTKGIEAFFRK